MNQLFTPIQLKHLSLKNRLVRSATQDYFGTKDGFVTPRQIELADNIAKHDLGMFITSHVCISARGRANDYQNCFYDDKFIPGQAQIAKTIQQYGVKAILQISHAGCSAPAWNQVPQQSPSGVPYFLGPRKEPQVIQKENQPATMTIAEIEQLKEDFAQAAKRAKTAGFDGIQLHFAHSYLISEFLNPLYNLRNDQYGGNKENRMRLGIEIIQKVKTVVGKDFPIFIKINSNIEENDTAFQEDFLYYIQQLDQAGVEGIEVSGWNFTPLGKLGQKRYYMERASLAAKMVKTPIILVGGVRNLDDAELVLNSGISLVSLARPFICEPNVSTIIKNGGQAKCISCSKCFVIYFKEGKVCVLHESGVKSAV